MMTDTAPPDWMEEAPHPATDEDAPPTMDEAPADAPILGAEATWHQAPAEEAAEKIAAWPDVFLRIDGASLVWCDDRGLPEMRPCLHEIDAPLLRGLIGERRLEFASNTRDKTTGKWSVKRVRSPAALVERIVTTRPGKWRVMRGMMDTPYLLASGELINAPGYRDGLWMSKSAAIDLATVPDYVHPRPEGYTAEHSAEFAKWFLDDLDGIEWATPADRSAAFAYALTLLSRAAYRRCPIILITAPLPGSGKDLVAKCMENAIYGMEAVRVTPPPGRQDDSTTELDKKIAAALLSGESTIVIGDAQKVCSPTIYGMVTEERSQGFRELGRSVAIPPPKCLIFVGIGNNPTIGTDIIRRAMSIRIVPSRPNPERRKFSRSEDSLIGEYRARRAIAICGLTNIIRGALHAGPRADMVECPFSGWASMVQAACMHAGLPDPLLARDALHQRTESADAGIGEFIAAWWDYRGSMSVSVAQAIAPLATTDEAHASVTYRAALRSLHPKIEPAILGKMLSAADDATFAVAQSDGTVIAVRLVHTKPQGRSVYSLVRC